MPQNYEWTLIGMLGAGMLFFVRDWFMKSATKSEVKIIRDKSEEAYKIASEAIISQNEIKFNYLDRFKDIQSNMNNNHLETITKLSELSVSQSKEFVRKEDCPFLHQQNRLTA